MTEETIFAAALEKSTPDERAAYLDEACAGDAVLRQRLETLLRSHDADGNFLGKPAIQCASEEVAGQACAEETHGNLPAEDGAAAALEFLAPADKPGVLGRLGHYEVLEVIGRGGMGIVLRAFDDKLHRVVALKVMAAQLATNGTARKRFQRESQAAAAVSHDHLVTIHAVEETNGLPYIAMQYVAGLSLQQRFDRDGPLQLQEILRIGMQTASGLAAAHAQGLVHRDIKPANILLENGVERVKITDFGLARAATEASLTQSGVVAGTPQYMSPEQAEGKAIDQRSDLFSLGSVLYAMCTGRAPFRASGTMAILKRVCEETPTPIRETNPDIPDWLVAIIDKLHAKDPANRYQTAAEVTDVLNQHLAHLQHPSIVPLPVNRPAQPSTAWPHRWAVAAVALLCLAGVGLAWYLNRGEEPSPGGSHAPPGKALMDSKGSALVKGALLWMSFEKDTFYSKGDVTYVRDLSGYGRDGMCEKSEFTPEGKAGGALRLQGGGLKVPHRLLNKQSEYTVAAWVFYDKMPSIGCFTLMQEYWLDKAANYTLAWFPHHLYANAWHTQHSGHWKGVNVAMGLPGGQWNFVVVRLKDGGLDQGEILVTCNGKTVKAALQMQGGASTGYCVFGEGAEGMLDELLLLPRSLSDDEVQLLFELGKQGRSPLPLSPTKTKTNWRSGTAP